MTNNEVRELIALKGITTDNVTQKQLMTLHDMLCEKLVSSGLFRGSFDMEPLKLSGDDIKYMTCKADYFKGREAISFNRDGFIGIAGWASTKSSEPIRRAVIDWANDGA